MEITGNENFKTGKNTVIISVKAENGDVREYKLIVNRKNTATTTLTEEEESGSTAEKGCYYNTYSTCSIRTSISYL